MQFRYTVAQILLDHKTPTSSVHLQLQVKVAFIKQLFGLIGLISVALQKVVQFSAVTEKTLFLGQVFRVQ